MTQINSKIKNIVVLMLENRSIDNLLGWLYADTGNQPLINIPPTASGKPVYYGLEEGKHFLPLMHEGKVVMYPVRKGLCGNDLEIPEIDPREEYVHVTNQLFGNETAYDNDAPDAELVPEMLGFLQDFTESYNQDKKFLSDYTDVLIKKLKENLEDYLSSDPGFIKKIKAEFREFEWEEIYKAAPYIITKLSPVLIQSWNQTFQILLTYTPSQLPVLNGLARNFAVSDMWFASVPSQTNPNRAFLACGTSLGRDSNLEPNAVEEFDTDTIWNVLSKHAPHISSTLYYSVEFPPGSGECYTGHTFPRTKNSNVKFFDMDQFYNDAAEGNLPAFSFLEPAWGWGMFKDLPFKNTYLQGCDYHPPTSVREGENFVKKVYESIINSPQWNETLFVITFDEHGGTFDHIAPPCPSPRPDNFVSDNGFKFDRYGVRVPTILISPWVDAGVVFRSEADLPYDHTSLTAMILKWAGVDPAVPDDGISPALGKRVAVAPTFENVINRQSPRTDKPVLQDPPGKIVKPILIRNETPSQLRIHLTFGPEITFPFFGKKRVPVKGWPQYVNPGDSLSYDTSADTERKLFDYYVAVSFRSGEPDHKPPVTFKNIFDFQINIKNDPWKFLSDDWILMTHHQTMTITQEAPVIEIVNGTAESMNVVNGTPSVMKLHSLTSDKITELNPGSSIELESKTGQDSLRISYFTGMTNIKDENYDTDGWKFIQTGMTKIVTGQTMIIKQDKPAINVICE